MIKYNISFNGRQSGAVGIFYDIKDTYKCEDLDTLKSLVYEDYEHIKLLVIKVDSKTIPTELFDKAKFIPVRPNKERERHDGSYLYTRSDSSLKHTL